MHDSKLIRLLKKLDSKERNRLRNFLKSTSSNDGNMPIRLFEYVIVNYPDFSSKRLEREQVISALYQNSPKGATQLRRDQYKLVTYIEDYFRKIEVDQIPHLQERLLLEALIRRASHRDFMETIQDIIEKIEGKNNPDLNDFQMLTDIYQALFFHAHTDKYHLNNEPLHKALHNLDKYYWLTRLRLHSELLLRYNLYNIPQLPPAIPPCPEDLLSNTQPVFELYLNLIQVLTDPEPTTTFGQTKMQLIKHIHQLSEYDKGNITTKLIYQANCYYEKKYFTFVNDIFELYKLAEQYHFIRHQNKITHMEYISIIAVAANAGQFDWARQFATTNLAFVEEKYQDTSKHLAQAYICFLKADHATTSHQRRNLYQTTLQALAEASKSHVANRLQMESLYLRTYYELELLGGDYFDDFDKCLARLKTIAQHHPTLHERKKQSISAFIEIIALLADYHREHDRKKQIALQQAIKELFEQSSSIYNGIWVEKKMQQW